MSRVAGFQAEALARSYLTEQGLTWVASNYTCRLGEIDLIMREGAFLVFIEVRARTSLAFGGGAASVTYSKQQKILKTAAYYLMVNKLQDKCPTRFDVLSLDGMPPQVTWIKDAFN